MSSTFPWPAHNILARRLIKKTFLFAMVTTVLLTIIMGCIAYFVEKESLHRQFEKIETSYIDFIRPALWINDTEMIDALLMGIGDFHEIEYAGIYVNGTLFSETGQKSADQKMDSIFPITHLYDGKTYQLGELHLKINHDFVKKQIFQTVFVTAATQALTIFIICGAVLWLMYQSLIQRLLAITRYTSTMSMESLRTPLILKKSNEQPDELDGLADAINHMRQNLHREFLRRKKAEDSIREHRDNLEKIVGERTRILQSTNEKLIQEIDQRKQAEKNLSLLKRRNQALLDHSPVSHKIVDLDFKLQYMSASGFKMLKIDNNLESEVYGKPYPFYFFPEAFQNKNDRKFEESKRYR
jgi:hypothetical protein